MQEHLLILMQALLIWISIQLGGSEKRGRNQVEVFGQVLVEVVEDVVHDISLISSKPLV